MGYIFNIPIAGVDTANPQLALKQMWKYIKTLENQLEWKLTNLDSTNVKEISTDDTKITSKEGSSFSGDSVYIKKGSYSFYAGVDGTTGTFKFEITDSAGHKAIYFNSSGSLVISRYADVNIDAGAW